MLTMTMRQWNSQAVVVWMYRPKPAQSQSWSETLGASAQTYPHPSLKKSACGDWCGQRNKISMMSHHYVYSQWHIGTVKLWWYGCTDPNWLNLSLNRRGPQAKHIPTYYSRVILWWLMCAMNSNLNDASPLSILTIRQCNSQAEVVWMYRPKPA